MEKKITFNIGCIGTRLKKFYHQIDRFTILTKQHKKNILAFINVKGVATGLSFEATPFLCGKWKLRKQIADSI